MPVYNSERYLSQAIESILSQTYGHFEFLIFDDGSTDSSPQIIRRYAEADSRIIAAFSDANVGYVKHLNRGIEIAKGEFIARMDSDDISIPERLEKQVEYMLDKPETGIVGSSAVIIDCDGRKLGINYRESDPVLLKWITFFTNPFYHSSLLIRKDLFHRVGMYDVAMQPAEDRDMWVRAFYETEFGNIREPLIQYRVHDQSISRIGQEAQVGNSEQCLFRHYKRYLNVELEPGIITFFREFHKRDVDISSVNIGLLSSTLIALRRKFLYENREELSEELVGKIEEEVFAKLLYVGINGIKAGRISSIGTFFRIFQFYPLLLFRFLGRKLLI